MRAFAALLLFAALPLDAQTADLVFARADVFGSRRDYRITSVVQNLGPGTAENVRVELQLPAGATVLRFYSDSLLHCTGTTCAFGSLALHESRAVTFDVRLAAVEGPQRLSLVATTATAELTPENNTFSRVFEIEKRADVYVTVDPWDVRVDPGETATFAARLTNSETTFPGTRFEVRLSLTGTTGASIESIDAPSWTCSIESASGAVCSMVVQSSDFCCSDQPIQVTVRASGDRGGGEVKMSVTPSSDVPGSRISQDVFVGVYRLIGVTTTADAGAGSLREAMHDANAHCTPGPCRISFEIPPPVPAEGWFTIIPATPLPKLVVSRVVLDGLTQTALTGDTNPLGPEVAIDGRLAGEGLEVHAGCDAAVRALALGNFRSNQGLSMTSDGVPCPRTAHIDTFIVERNHLGVDPRGAPWPNLRGLRLDGARSVSVTHNVISHNHRSGVWMFHGRASFTSNVVDHNGASGIFLGPFVNGADIFANTFTGQGHMGVAIAHGARIVDLRSNRMRDNSGLGIDWGLDGPSRQVENDSETHTNAPTVLSAIYDAAKNETVVAMTVRTRTFAPYSAHVTYAEVFANRAPDGDGEEPVGAGYVRNDGQPSTVIVPGDWRGKWINATVTREAQVWSKPGDRTSTNSFWPLAMTSELSNSVLAE